MALSLVSRRSLLVALVTACGQLVGCRHKSPKSLNTWVRRPYDICEAVAVPTIVLPTLGEGTRELRCEFQRALSAQLRKSKHMRILDGELTTVGADCPCPSSSMTWDNQLEILLNVPATQAVVSKITFLQATAPVKLGVVVALKDVATRETTRQVEGLWDSPFCAPPSIRRCLGKRVAEPRWKSELSKISPRQLVEQAALEISLDLQQTEFSADMDVACTGGKSTQCTPPALPTTPFPNSDR